MITWIDFIIDDPFGPTLELPSGWTNQSSIMEDTNAYALGSAAKSETKENQRPARKVGQKGSISNEKKLTARKLIESGPSSEGNVGEA